MRCCKEERNEHCVCPGRQRRGHPGGEPCFAGDFRASQSVTQSGLDALEQALAESQQALNRAQVIEDANARRHILELAARDARYFAERPASAVPQPEPLTSTTVAFGSRVEILRDNGRRQTFQVVGEDEAILAPDRSPMCFRLPIISSESRSVRPWRWTATRSRSSAVPRNRIVPEQLPALAWRPAGQGRACGWVRPAKPLDRPKP
jgi:hypothetical protein